MINTCILKCSKSHPCFFLDAITLLEFNCINWLYLPGVYVQFQLQVSLWESGTLLLSPFWSFDINQSPIYLLFSQWWYTHMVFKPTTPCDYQLKTMPTWQCIPQSVLAYSLWCFNLRHCCKPFKSTIHVLQTEFLLLLKLLSCQKGIRHLLVPVTHV